jgi:hypothetical protein
MHSVWQLNGAKEAEAWVLAKNVLIHISGKIWYV